MASPLEWQRVARLILHAQHLLTICAPFLLEGIVACGVLSLISVLGIFVFLGYVPSRANRASGLPRVGHFYPQMSVVRSCHSSDENALRSHPRWNSSLAFSDAISLELLVPSSTLIAWTVEQRVFVGRICTDQATFKQICSV